MIGNTFNHPSKLYTLRISLGFGVLTVIIRKNSIFWDTMPCGLMKVNCFGEAKQEASTKAGGKLSHHLSRFPFVSFFHPEDGGDMFLQNVR
jgi:hypothetical protein